ncbi:MAG: A/G-specific adenine glycosylase [Lutibacter sp.]|uniref:A/G-specific adenine glycosylase n=1 Tax=Lutibacter sp. TaxID=1925666 RepID=UPI00299DD96F|nr:A/G-specific adenine glycosylase [Lutibacter sp.]MDX1828499.1 A/G-specific adenine glycosylase [Lutibacter sp.]
MNFSNSLIHWYLANKRDLPWRNTKNPYNIWLSEIILQQTKVNQGLPYYFKFIQEFPTIFDLAKAPEEKVLKLWQGLGYYSRARNLHFSAQYIVNELNGEFPVTYNELIKLKGVGDYTASAIASICNNEKTAVVDGNVYRLLARYFGVFIAINSSKGIKEFKLLAQDLIDSENPGTFNQAVMEFGATVCTPKKPKCSNCILKDSCFALSKNEVDKLPVKEKKIIIKTRYFNYLVFKTSTNKTILEQRTNGIWKNLYQFPLIETKEEIDENKLINHKEFLKICNSENHTIKLFNDTVKPHKLSHQHIYAKFWIVKTNDSNKISYSWETIKKYPVPLLIDNFINEFINF